MDKQQGPFIAHCNKPLSKGSAYQYPFHVPGAAEPFKVWENGCWVSKDPDSGVLPGTIWCTELPPPPPDPLIVQMGEAYGLLPFDDK